MKSILFVLSLLAMPACRSSISETQTQLLADSDSRSAQQPVRLPLKTKGRYVVDQEGRRVKLRSINWYGASDDYFTVLGLYTKHRDALSQTILDMKFNSVRLPFSNELLQRQEPVVSQFLKANPDLIGKTPLQVFDAIIDSLTKAKIMVILNNHTSDATWCCGGKDNNGLWYNPRFGEDRWIEDWVFLAKRYKNNPWVVGADLRNELRPDSKMGRSPNWGKGGESDWKQAAQKAGNAILAVQPNWLIVVEGLSYSANFDKVRDNPVKLNQPNRVVYSPHAYSWFTNFSAQTTYRQAEKFFDSKWGFIVKNQGQPYTAPVWVSEFGTGLGSDKPGSAIRVWWNHFMCYMHKHDIDYSYWSFTGGKIKAVEGKDTPKTEATEYKITWNGGTYGLTNKSWDPIPGDWRLKDIHDYLLEDRKDSDKQPLDCRSRTD